MKSLRRKNETSFNIGLYNYCKYIEKQPARNFKIETIFSKYIKFIILNKFTIPPTQHTFYVKNYS